MTRLSFRVVGVDPGPTPGIVRLDYTHAGARPDVQVVQCTADVFWAVLPEVIGHLDTAELTVIAVEHYAVGRRSGRTSSAGANHTTLTMARALQQLYPGGIHRIAGAVKPWATDDRLEAAGIAEATKGMRHARDAGRHALFAAVRDLGATDPLSSTYPSGSTR